MEREEINKEVREFLKRDEENQCEKVFLEFHTFKMMYRGLWRSVHTQTVGSDPEEAERKARLFRRLDNSLQDFLKEFPPETPKIKKEEPEV